MTLRKGTFWRVLEAMPDGLSRISSRWHLTESRFGLTRRWVTGMLDGLHQILRSRRPGQNRLSKPVGMTGKAHQIQHVPIGLEEENTQSKSTAGEY